MVEEEWFFHEVDHELDITLIKDLISTKRLIEPAPYNVYSGHGDLNQYFFQISDYHHFDYIGKHILENLGKSSKKYSMCDAWTIDGHAGSNHSIHKHNNSDEPSKGLSILMYLDLPKDMEDMKGWFFYIDKSNEVQYIKPRLGTALVFTNQILHGTIEQSSGIRKTFNMGYRENEK